MLARILVGHLMDWEEIEVHRDVKMPHSSRQDRTFLEYKLAIYDKAKRLNLLAMTTRAIKSGPDRPILELESPIKVQDSLHLVRSQLVICNILKKVTNLFQTGLFPHKKVKFAKLSTKQVCNVKKRPLQCLMLKKVTNLFQIGLFAHKKVKFAKFRTKQVCNVKKKPFQCLTLNIILA